MRSVQVRSAIVLAVVCLAAGSFSGARGEEKAAEPLKYVATIHEDGKEKDIEIDLSKESTKKEELRKLTQLLAEGEVEHLVKDEPPKLLNVYWDLGLWTLVVFGLLFLVLRKMAWGPMLEGLKRREDNIRSAVVDAQQARDEAARLRNELQQEMDRAQDKVREIHDEARRLAQKNTEEMLVKARADIQGERERLRRDIDTARDQALQELWNQTAQLSTLVAAKAIRRQITPDDQRRLVDETLAELKNRGITKANGHRE